MSRFSTIKFKRSDRALLEEVRALAGKEWSTGLDPIKRLRTRLRELQNHRCCYCQAPIEADEAGFRELEHILPKAKSRNCTMASGTSNHQAKRRSTLGYQEFAFEPSNLAMSCKQCNNYKGMHDPLKDRTAARPLKAFPKAGELIWYHPHTEPYEKHITIDDDFGFTGETEGGRAIIRECKLLDPEVLDRKFQERARVRAAQASSFRQTVDALASGVELKTFSKSHAIQALASKHPIAATEARDIIERRLDYATSVQSMKRYLDSILKYEDTTV